MQRCVVVAAVLAGCFKPVPPEGAPCTATDECPSPLMCVAGKCYSSGTAIDAPLATDAPLDADLACSCSGNTLVCPAGNTPCDLSCSTTNGPHCTTLVPSNGITPQFPPGNTGVAIGVVTTFDTDTGAVTGGITRAAGTGITGGIGFQTATFGSTPLGVFTFHVLTVSQGGVVHFTGSRAAVFVVEKDATISGLVDASGGCYGTSMACPGPGGGAGGTYSTPAGGCGPGGRGTNDIPTGADTGGGGGGGGTDGAPGGVETASTSMFAGGTAGLACIAPSLEPLAGGGGGGGGGPGRLTTLSKGGGGGGGFQLTSLASVIVAGIIDAGGEGGEGGVPDPNTTGPNSGAGGGGGAGGAVLLEGVTVSVTGTVVANGGGGGGGASGSNAGAPGADGTQSSAAALGGAGAGSAGDGGNGGTGAIAPTKGGDSLDVNAGAGGGGAGRVMIRAGSHTGGGTISPPPAIAQARSQ